MGRTLPTLGMRSGGPREQALLSVAKAEVALDALSDDELDAEYQKAKAEAVAEMLGRGAREEAARWFNQPTANADFAHWAKCAYWNVYEGVALILGKDPNVVNWESLRSFAKISTFVQEFDRIVDLAFRAVAVDQLGESNGPGTFIAWAKRYDIPVPAELEAAVANFGHFVGDWKTLFDQTKKQLDEARARERATEEAVLKLKAEAELILEEITALRSARVTSAKPIKGADPREVESLRKLCIGMAMQGYSFDPAETRSDKIAEIVGDLERLGIPLNRDTVRRHLKAGAELLAPDALEKARK